MAVTLPANMRAMRVTRFGEAADAFAPAELPVPAPRAGEVLIRVVASSVNPADVKMRRHGGALVPKSGVFGMDVAGVVVAFGEGVSEYRIGDRVFGCAGGLGELQGALAEYMAADVRLIAPAPRNIPLREAAALPLVSITAFEGLFDRARLQPGERVLVLGAVGGVGHLVTQLAAQAGAQVTAQVSSADKAALARDFGASEIVLRGEETLEAAVQRITGGAGFDVVFDTTGLDNFTQVFASTRPQGQAITLVTRFTVDLTPMFLRALSLHAVFMLVPMIHGVGRERHTQILREIAARVEAGTLRPLVDPQRFALADIAAAHARVEAGQALGKLVIDIADE